MGERTVTLRDGTVALLRPIRPEDAERLRRGLRQLSPRSRYLRFHAPVHELTDQQLAYLTQVDQRDHCAWVALDPEALDEPGMGVARYVRLADEPEVAEAAVTVVDRYQGRGVGSALLRVIAEQAAANGISTLRNYVLADNTAMLEVLDGLGARRSPAEPGVWQVDVDVPEPEGELRRTAAGRLFSAISSGALVGRLPAAMEWLAQATRRHLGDLDTGEDHTGGAAAG